MNDDGNTILIYGYGNPGRQDDGLGIMLAGEIETWKKETGISAVEVDMNYQLNIEDAEKISNYHTVIFVDASVEDISTYKLDRVVPDLKTDFSMHAVTPSFVAGLCQRIYGRLPEVYQLHVKGYSWEFMQNLSEEASKNLRQATNFLVDYLKTKKKIS